LEAPIGDSLSGGIFLYFYAFYNPVSRKSLVAKKRELNESKAILLSFKHSEVWKKGSAWVRFNLYCVHIWQLLCFSFKSNVAECQPMVVREALEHPEARLFQRLSLILHHHNDSKSHAKQNSVSDASGDGCFNKLVQFFKQVACRKKLLNPNRNSSASSSTMRTELEPPTDFMEIFSEKIAFISEALPNDSVCILLAILIFDQEEDLGDSRAAKAYLQLMQREFESMKAAVRSVFSVVHDVLEAEQQVQLDQHRIVRSLKDILLGREGQCLLHFLSVSSPESGEFFVGKGLVDFSKHEMLVIPVAQLMSAQSQIISKPGLTHVNRRTDLIADVRTALDTSNTPHSNSTRPFRQRSNSMPNVQMPLASLLPTPQGSRPQMYAAEEVRADDDAGESVRSSAAAVRSLSASQADPNETLKLMLEEMTARVQVSEKEILSLKKALTQKDIEISALEASNYFLMNERASFAALAPSAAAPADAPL
jgi:hypothetical protein